MITVAWFKEETGKLKVETFQSLKDFVTENYERFIENYADDTDWESPSVIATVVEDVRWCEDQITILPNTKLTEGTAELVGS